MNPAKIRDRLQVFRRERIFALCQWVSVGKHYIWTLQPQIIGDGLYQVGCCLLCGASVADDFRLYYPVASAESEIWWSMKSTCGRPFHVDTGASQLIDLLPSLRPDSSGNDT